MVHRWHTARAVYRNPTVQMYYNCEQTMVAQDRAVGYKSRVAPPGYKARWYGEDLVISTLYWRVFDASVYGRVVVRRGIGKDYGGPLCSGRIL